MPPPRYASELERTQAEVVILGARVEQCERELSAARERIVALETRATDLRRDVDRLDAEVTALDSDVHDSDVKHIETRGVLTSLAEGTSRLRAAEEAAAKKAEDERALAKKQADDDARIARQRWWGFGLAMAGTALAALFSWLWHKLTGR